MRHSDESKLHEKRVDFGLELQRGGGAAGVWVGLVSAELPMGKKTRKQEVRQG